MKLFAALLTAVVALLPLASGVQAADVYKPFILAYRGAGDMQTKVAEVKQALAGAGFQVVGDYEPYADAHVIIFTNDALKKVAAKSEYGGFAAAQRAAVTKVGDELQVAYVNPVYMAYAYRLKDNLANTAETLAKALGNIQEFGSEKGLTERKLGRYHYTFGMEYFNDPYDLATYASHEEALKAVEQNLASNTVGVRQLYRIDIPGKEETIYGVSMQAGPNGDQYMDDKFQMGVVNFGELKGTPYLPYEVMVTGNRVVALHMRFRMAVHYPDLKMMGENSFMKLMPSPEAIRKALTVAVGGNP
jgi:hypothetical protein